MWRYRPLTGIGQSVSTPYTAIQPPRAIHPLAIASPNKKIGAPARRGSLTELLGLSSTDAVEAKGDGREGDAQADGIENPQPLQRAMSRGGSMRRRWQEFVADVGVNKGVDMCADMCLNMCVCPCM